EAVLEIPDFTTCRKTTIKNPEYSKIFNELVFFCSSKVSEVLDQSDEDTYHLKGELIKCIGNIYSSRETGRLQQSSMKLLDFCFCELKQVLNDNRVFQELVNRIQSLLFLHPNGGSGSKWVVPTPAPNPQDPAYPLVCHISSFSTQTPDTN